MSGLAKSWLLTLCSALLVTGSAAAQTSTRSAGGLLALYEFNELDGEWIRDRSGQEPAIDLRIADQANVRLSDGAMEIIGETQILSANPPGRLIETIRRTGSLTVEAWLQPAATNQTGPARIVTLSRDTGIRNFTLGQENESFDVRLRTTENGNNGTPSLASPSGSLSTELVHVVYTRSRTGEARLYLDGELSAEYQVGGRFSVWNDFHLGLANERGGGRPWLGRLSLVAIYGRPLKPTEIRQHYEAGPEAPTPVPAGLGNAGKAALFENEIAPLLADNCLECHDSSNPQGGLDLSKRLAALAGGESGPAIMTGDAQASLLWQLVSEGTMPEDRAPLTEQEVQRLKDWINQGAEWTLERIDPANYTHQGLARDKWVRRLTIDEYIETVRQETGVDISQEARELLPPDLRADGFSNTAYNLGVDLKHIDAYARLAEIIVQQMDVPTFANRFARNRRFTDDDMGILISRMGKRLLRGPLDDFEVSVYRGISTTVASAGGDFDEAAGLIIEAMLQSPRFLYRMENQIGTGDLLPVSEYELASRMSYIVWGGPPDDELIRLADNGSLFDSDVISQQLDRMLAHPRARVQSRRFIQDWLQLDRLNNLRPDLERYPNWNPELAAAMQQETLAFFDEVVWDQQLPLSQLLNAPLTYATPELAQHYGFANAASNQEAPGLARYDLSDEPNRGGLLTQGSVLTVGGDDASMVTRGLLVMHELLRGVVKDPPPCVNTTPVPTQPGLTQRAIAMQRVKNPNCGGCHSKFEPLAFGLEPFDGLGTYHSQDEHGNELHDHGEILFPGADSPTAYASSKELMNLLAESPRVKQSLTWKLTQFALGRPLTATDVAQVDQIHEEAMQAGGRYTDTVKAIIASDLVQLIHTRQPETLDQP